MKEETMIVRERPDGFTWRPARITDLPGLTTLYAAIDAAYGTHWGGTEEELRADFEEPGLDVEQDTLLALTPAGEIAALGWLMPSHASQDKVDSLLWGITHPEYCRRGLGSALLAWLEERAWQKFHDQVDGKPFYLRTAAADTTPDRTALYESHGYRLVRTFYRMRRSFSTPIPEKPLPAGIRIVPWIPERESEALDAINTAFEDHWASAPITKEQWDLFVTGSPSFRPEFSLMALAGDRLVGACVNRIREDEIARTGIREGWIGTLGVIRDWRGRGVGSQLLCESMRRFQASGFTSAGLSVDAENLTGALAIYERLGFAPIQRSFAYAKPLEAAIQRASSPDFRL